MFYIHGQIERLRWLKRIVLSRLAAPLINSHEQKTLEAIRVQNVKLQFSQRYYMTRVIYDLSRRGRSITFI